MPGAASSLVPHMIDELARITDVLSNVSPRGDMLLDSRAQNLQAMQ